MNKLELKHLAPYLPYGLKMYCPYGFRPNGKETTGVHRVVYLTGDLYADIENNTYQGEVFKPILRPMSDLTKKIEHNGEMFVPLVRLHQLKESNHFSKDDLLRRLGVGIEPKIIDCESKSYDGYGHHQLRFPIETTNIGTLVYSFGYSERFDRFEQRDETLSKPLGVGYQKQLFEKCYEWFFDFNGLIDQGLAIDINSLNKEKV